jgi:aryl-alcohol dehydrogenase-like predicted oxidoreductase
MYGRGENERLLGKVVNKCRDKVIIASKFGVIRNNEKKAINSFAGINGSPEYVRKVCEKSLKQLNTDYIDLYYLHRLDPEVPIEETVGEMSKLVAEGKIRYIGLSEVDEEILKRACRVHQVTALQSEYSLMFRGVEEKILPVCRELGIGFVCYSPLGKGLLSGKITSPEDLSENDWRRDIPQFQKENLSVYDDSLKSLKEMASEKGATPAQIALAWLLHKGNDIIPIPGTSHKVRMKENAESANIALSDNEISALQNMFIL